MVEEHCPADPPPRFTRREYLCAGAAVLAGSCPYAFVFVALLFKATPVEWLPEQLIDAHAALPWYPLLAVPLFTATFLVLAFLHWLAWSLFARPSLSVVRA